MKDEELNINNLPLDMYKHKDSMPCVLQKLPKRPFTVTFNRHTYYVNIQVYVIIENL